MVPANKAQVVGKFIAPAGRVARKENAPAKETKTLHIEPRSPGVIGVYIKLIDVPLDPRFVCHRGVELMEPRTLQSAVPGKFRSAAGEGRQRLEVRVLFRKMGKAVTQKALIAVAEPMIETRGKIVRTDREREQPAIGRELIHNIGIQD